MFPRFFIFIFVFALLQGCKHLSPNSEVSTPIHPPDHWSITSDHYITNLKLDDWADELGSQVLSDYIQEGISQNFSLQAAAARLARAQAVASISGADRWPSINAGFRSSRSRRNVAVGDDFSEVISDSYKPSFDLSWELDLWGKVRDSHQAGIADWQAAQEVYASARLSLAGNIAKSWVSLIESKKQLELSEQTLQSFENNLAVVKDNFMRGIARALDYQLSKSNVAATQSNVERNKRIYDSNIRKFQSLVGRYPDAALSVEPDLPDIRAQVPVGLPSELLLRRPDVIEAERRLIANSKQVSVAKKSLIPSIRLTSSAGIESSELSEITNSQLFIWNFVGNLTQPLFHGKRLKSSVKRAEANYEEALANYGNKVLVAFQEVESFLAADLYYNQEYQARKNAADEAKRSAAMAWEEYVKGLTTISTLLETQRRSFNADTSLLQVSAQRVISRINLYLALGGSFESPEKQ